MSLDNLPSIYVHKTEAVHAAETDSTHRSPLLMLVIAMVTFLILTSLVAHYYRSVNGAPYMAVLTEKLEDFTQDASDYDIVFLGTSETFRHVDPQTISDTLSQGGQDLSVYNFGVPALNFAELRFLVDRMAERPATGRKFVVIQNPLPAGGDLNNLLTDRGRYFRSGARVGDTASEVVCYTGTSLGLFRRIYSNTLAVSAETVGFGRLGSTLFPVLGEQELGYDPAYRTNHGYWPVERDLTDHVAERSKHSPMTPEKMQTYIAGGGMKAPRDGRLACRAGLILDLVRDLEEAGYTVIYFNPPTVKFSPLSNAVRDKMIDLDPNLKVLDFDSASHAEFTAPDLWFDESHMKDEGAQRLSHLIGERLIDIISNVETLPADASGAIEPT